MNHSILKLMTACLLLTVGFSDDSCFAADRLSKLMDDAIAQYRRTLELDPEHAQASAKLTQLGE